MSIQMMDESAVDATEWAPRAADQLDGVEGVSGATGVGVAAPDTREIKDRAPGRSREAQGPGSIFEESTTPVSGVGAAQVGVPGRGSRGRINPDDGIFVRIIITGTLIAGVVAFAISFVALMDVAVWLGIPSWMAWAVPTFIDLAILIYAGSILVHKARGERTWRSWLMLGNFTVLSMVANIAHAFSEGATTEVWQSWVGALIAGMVPFAIFAATEQLASIAVEDPETRRQELEAQAVWAAQQADREREQIGLEHQREMARQKAELGREEHLTELEIAKARRGHLVERAAQGVEVDEARQPDRRSVRTSSGVESGGPSANGRPGSDGGADLQGLVEFVESRVAVGARVTGKDLSEEFGFSDKTGRRRLSQLRERHPELFETAVTGGWKAES